MLVQSTKKFWCVKFPYLFCHTKVWKARRKKGQIILGWKYTIPDYSTNVTKVQRFMNEITRLLAGLQ